MHAERELPAGVVRMRDVLPEDIPHFVDYWHHQGDAHLRQLNIDRERLGPPEVVAERFRDAIRTGRPEQLSVAVSFDLDGALIGYANLNRRDARHNYPHVHLIDRNLRAIGCVSVMLPPALAVSFGWFPDIERVVLQTRARVQGINRVLDLYLPVEETAWLDDPDGVAGPGTFHSRYVERCDLPRIEARGREIEAQLWTGGMGVFAR